MPRAALLEDDPDTSRLLRLWLEAGGHDCRVYAEGARLVRDTARHTFDLFVLDWNVPGLSGIDVLLHIRAGRQRTAPVLMVTARDTEADIVKGLRSGADDYLAKPVGRAEFMARVEALERRVQRLNGQQGALEVGPYRAQGSCIRVEGRAVRLTAKEFELAALLLANAGTLLSRSHIEQAVWARPEGVSSRTLDTHVSRLRRKLEVARLGWQIAAVYSFGYRLEQVQATGVTPS